METTVGLQGRDALMSNESKNSNKRSCNTAVYQQYIALLTGNVGLLQPGACSSSALSPSTSSATTTPLTPPPLPPPP